MERRARKGPQTVPTMIPNRLKTEPGGSPEGGSGDMLLPMTSESRYGVPKGELLGSLWDIIFVPFWAVVFSSLSGTCKNKTHVPVACHIWI